MATTYSKTEAEREILNAGLAFTAQPLPRKNTKYIILHHAAAAGSVESIHQHHRYNNGWLGIGYNYYVRKNGTIWRGRPENSTGAHTVGYNDKSIGICFEGNFETEIMGEAQLQAGKWLIRDILRRYPEAIVGGHRDFDTTACPGKNFPEELLDMDEMNEEELYMDIESLINNMTDEQAYRLLEKAQCHAAQLPAPGWAQAELAKAVAAGVTDGERPMQLIPRYQAAIMAARAGK